MTDAMRESAPTPPTQYECQLRAIEGDLLSALNGIGAEGWQIVQLLPQPTGQMAVLVQRPRSAVVLPTGEEVRKLSLVGA